jgi:elongation factor 1-beta
MAKVIITLKIMPESPDIDLHGIEKHAKEEIKKFGAEFGKSDIVPVAFGLKSLNIMIISEESKGSTDELEKKIAELKGVNSCETIDVRRTIG